jgi:DNA-binding CsgD family transcriptional regulator
MLDKRILAALAIQVTALGLFVYEFIGTVVAVPVFQVPWSMHEIIELLSIIGLAVGAGLTLTVLRRSLRRTARVEEQLRIASDAFHAVLMSKFDEWQLTPSERDNALLIVKGFSIAEMARIRNKSEGTIKAQNSSIYQKSGLAGRVQLVTHFIEELTADEWIRPLRDAETDDDPRGRAPVREAG